MRLKKPLEGDIDLQQASHFSHLRLGMLCRSSLQSLFEGELLRMKKRYAVLLLCCLSGTAMAAMRTDPVVASFDCKKAKSNYETLVCGDYGLAAADIQMSGAYRQALILTPEKDKKREIVAEQRKWLKTISSMLHEKIASKSSPEELKKFLDTSLRKRIWSLSNKKSEIGETIILDASPTSKAVCFSLLSEENIKWEGKNDYGHDNFTITIPSEFVSPPDWDNAGIAQHAKFDFMNVGKPSDIFSVSMEGTHYQFHYYIVATPEEKTAIEKLFSANAMEDESDIPKYFVYAAPNTRTKSSPTFKSILFDTSSSPVYGWGWYTKTQIAQKNGITYLISTSVNNLQGPTFTVFKPNGSRLNAICYYRASPSTEK